LYSKDFISISIRRRDFRKITHGEYFTVIDLTSGYFQVPLDQASRSCTAFMCSKGTFQFNVLPMGVTNAVETFQRLMDHVLRDLIGHICEVYLDDIIINSSTLHEHLHHVKIIVDRLKQHNLKIKLSKCKIAQKEVVYLSHTISKGTIKPSQEKVKDLLKYTSPLTTKQTHSFVGLGSYHRKFIPNYASIAAPLIQEANEKIMVWTDQCQQAFNKIQHLLTNEPILQLPDFERSFILESDGSQFGAGSVLSQERQGIIKPVAYYSRSLSKPEKNYYRSLSQSNTFVNFYMEKGLK
jgi:hypothetical protein